MTTGAEFAAFWTVIGVAGERIGCLRDRTDGSPRRLLVDA